MSGAEAILALSVAANVLQFVEFTAKLCARIRDYSKGLGVPKKLARQADQLDHLLQILRSLCEGSHQESLERQIVASCEVQAEELYCLLESLSGSEDGQGRWFKTAKKALKSLNRAERVIELQSTLDSLVNTLSLQLHVTTRDQSHDIVANTVSILQQQENQTKTLDEIHHLAQLRLDTSNKSAIDDHPIWLIPVGRNLEFVGRGNIIEGLQERLVYDSDAVQKAVLYGLGGVGKSQIALEFAYREKDGCHGVSVFWVHATNTARFIESFKRIASGLEIPGLENPEIDVPQLVRDYLESKYRCPWLMVVDNVDDRIMFFEDQSYKGKALCEYIPQTSRGAVLYTTRNRDVGVDLDSHRKHKKKNTMNIQDAQSLLGSKIRDQSTQAEQLELLEELVYLPLAIIQAVACMIKRKKNIRQYLEVYRQSDSTRIRLLGQGSMHHGRESRPLESVATTWWISFNNIRSENARAAKLLSVMSFLDRQGIPDSLLVEDDEDSLDFDEAIDLLDSYSLVTRNSADNTSNMHRLVQMATLAWLRDYEGSSEEVAGEALNLMGRKFPDGTFENWGMCATYLPHGDAVLRYKFAGPTKDVQAARAQLLVNTASYLRRQGRFEMAKMRSAESRQIREKLFGHDHEDTLAAIAEYAMVIHKDGDWEDATELQRMVLAGREKVLGPNHRLTLETLNALGYDLRSLGKYKEAEEIHRRERKQKQKLLDDNPDDWGLQADFLVAINNNARLLSHQGRHAEAEKMYRDSLEKTVKLMGNDHPDTLITMGELASDLRAQDKFEESEKTYEALLERRIRVLGELHPDTLLTKSNLATLLGRQGRNDEAERMYRQVYQEEIQVLGAKHPSTVNSLHNLAWILADQGRGKEAVKTFETVLDIQEEVLGKKHPDTFNTRMNLVIALNANGMFEETEKIINEAMRIALCYPEDHDSGQLRNLARLATILADQERFSETEEVCKHELCLRDDLSGVDDSDADNCRQILALALTGQRKFDDAIVINKEILDYRVKTLGWEHEHTSSVLWNLAMCYRDAEVFEKAEQSFGTLLDLESKKLGRDDPEVLEVLLQVAWLQQQLKEYNESETNYRRLLAAQTRIAGPEDQLSIRITNNLASVLNYQGKNEQAEELFRTACTTRLKVLGPEHPLTKKSLRSLVNLLEEIGKLEEATPFIELLNENAEAQPVSAEEHRRN